MDNDDDTRNLLLDGQDWLPSSRVDFLDGVEDNTVGVYWDSAGLWGSVRKIVTDTGEVAYLDKVEASAAYTTHQRLQRHAPVISSVYRDFVRDVRVSLPLSQELMTVRFGGEGR